MCQNRGPQNRRLSWWLSLKQIFKRTPSQQKTQTHILQKPQPPSSFPSRPTLTRSPSTQWSQINSPNKFEKWWVVPLAFLSTQTQGTLRPWRGDARRRAPGLEAPGALVEVELLREAQVLHLRSVRMVSASRILVIPPVNIPILTQIAESHRG